MSVEISTTQLRSTKVSRPTTTPLSPPFKQTHTTATIEIARTLAPTHRTLRIRLNTQLNRQRMAQTRTDSSTLTRRNQNRPIRHQLRISRTRPLVSNRTLSLIRSQHIHHIRFVDPMSATQTCSMSQQLLVRRNTSLRKKDIDSRSYPAIQHTRRRNILRNTDKIITIGIRHVRIRPLKFRFQAFSSTMPSQSRNVNSILASNISQITYPSQFPIIRRNSIRTFNNRGTLTFNLFRINFTHLRNLIRLAANNPRHLTKNNLHAKK